jgi:hypothetical protein
MWYTNSGVTRLPYLILKFQFLVYILNLILLGENIRDLNLNLRISTVSILLRLIMHSCQVCNSNILMPDLIGIQFSNNIWTFASSNLPCFIPFLIWCHWEVSVSRSRGIKRKLLNQLVGELTTNIHTKVVLPWVQVGVQFLSSWSSFSNYCL